VSLLKLGACPALHKKQIIRCLRSEIVIVAAIAFLSLGVFSYAKLAERMVKVCPLSFFAMICHVPGKHFLVSFNRFYQILLTGSQSA
jgi:hypothetical protein